MGKFLAVALIIVYVLLLYYLIFGKRKKEEKRRKEVFARLKTGSRVITISGVHGTVVDMDDRNVILEICCEEGKSIKAKALKGAVMEVYE